MWSSLAAQQLRFKHITNEEGLSTNSVKAILQDQLGFMWFGTQDGLNKYDGYDLKIFRNDPGIPYSLSSSYITALEQVSAGRILVGTRDGLNLLDPYTERFSLIADAATMHMQVTAITKISETEALVGSQQGLFLVDVANGRILHSFFNKQRVQVTCIRKLNNITYIATAGNSLYRLHPGKRLEKITFTRSEDLNEPLEVLNSITSMAMYGGKLYLGTPASGICKVDQSYELETVYRFDKVNGSNDIRDFVIRNNRIYAASANGIEVLNLVSGRINLYQKTEDPLSLNSNVCTAIYTDAFENFWIGTDMGGVNISFFRSQKFPVSGDGYETQVADIFSFNEIDNNTLLIGGKHFLKELDFSAGTFVTHKGFDELIVHTIDSFGAGLYAIGTDKKGLLLFDRKKNKLTPLLEPLENERISAVLNLTDQLLVGTSEGRLMMLSLATGSAQAIPLSQDLQPGAINCFFIDARNNLWMGTSEAGLIRFSGIASPDRVLIDKQYRNLGKAGQLASNSVFGINQDASGIIWVATSSGLSKMKGDSSFHNFYNRNGLVNSFLHSIIKDSSQQFWMSTNNGLIQFDPSKPEGEMVFKNYNMRDGLVNVEFNHGAALLGKSGRLYFGGAKGFNTFRPSLVRNNLRPPQVYVVGYKRLGQDVPSDTQICYKKHLELSWSENYFQFELAAIDFTDPEKNLFRYKLEGYDLDWSAPSSVRYVSYTQLPGGNYVFKVKSANNDGTWNEKPFELSITVVPPFWRTKAFYGLLVIFALGIIYAYTQYRTRTILRENKILEAKVAARTRELEEKNRDITSSIEYARRIQEAILPSKEHIFRKLKKVFILYQPKDIVSGDFYWFAEEDGYKIFAVVDCTGHGVPGAFMSMIGHNLLHQIVLEKGITDPGEILNNLHRGVQEALRQGHNEINTNDGMDVSLISISDRAGKILWAGANRPLVIIDANRELVKYDGNKFPIGGAQLDHERKFQTREIVLNGPSMAYMFTDGYADQFGGQKGKKFMVKRFHDLLSEIHMLDPEEQRARLKANFEDWRQNHEQVDDVLIVGIQV